MATYPHARRLYVVQDNWSIHTHPDVLAGRCRPALLRSTPGGRVQQEQRTFATMTDDLLALLDWLVAAGCTHVAMESTGVYTSPMMLSNGSRDGSM